MAYLQLDYKRVELRLVQDREDLINLVIRRDARDEIDDDDDVNDNSDDVIAEMTIAAGGTRVDLALWDGPHPANTAVAVRLDEWINVAEDVPVEDTICGESAIVWLRYVLNACAQDPPALAGYIQALRALLRLAEAGAMPDVTVHASSAVRLSELSKHAYIYTVG